jgi:hypothetical protein
MKTVIGLLIIAFGIFLEMMWLGICFGTVFIGILLLIFAPSILFFPFNFFLLIGLSVMKGKVHTSHNFKYQNYSQYNNTYTKPEENIDKYYKILESQKTDSFEVIKKRYRKLMKEYHYDSIASKDLPQEMIEFAEAKSKELNEAYSAIKKIRG